MNGNQPYPDGMYSEHADYLATHTDLTEKEAEAYLRNYFAPDDLKQRRVANQMGVSPSTFSKHLGNAQDKIEGDDATVAAIKPLLSVTEIGGVDGKTKQVIGSRKTPNALAIVTEDAFTDADRLAMQYKLHVIYRENALDIDFDDAPEDIVLYDLWQVLTVDGGDDAHLVESAMYYLEHVDALDAIDLIGIAKMFEDLGFDTRDVPMEEYLERFDSWGSTASTAGAENAEN